MTEWRLFCIEPGKNKKAVQWLRTHGGLEVIHLMAFKGIRKHRTAKTRRKTDLKNPYPVLGPYVAIELRHPADLMMLEFCPHRISVPPSADWQHPLSQAGVNWFKNPPREMFPDTAVPRASNIRTGDRVGVYTCRFDGYVGEVISISGNSARVQFKDSFFEVSVPVESIARVA